MAVRRMFSREVCETDAFLDLPATAQRLYFFLGLQADDEGFLQNANSVARLVGSSRDDLNILSVKRFIIPFESGVVVIRHWKQHNYVPPDRFHPTKCLHEKALLGIDPAKTYELGNGETCVLSTARIQAVAETYPEGREGEGRENVFVTDAPPPKKSKRFAPPTIDEVIEYCRQRGNGVDAQKFVDFYESKGWMVGKNSMKDWKAAVRTWETRDSCAKGGNCYADAYPSL